MNQEKIGLFISNLRKEKDMTQLELANKLGVTDRAISKWENGRGMPDLSLIRNLCEILEISINELLNGERIEEKEYLKVSDNNIYNTLEYGKQELKKRNKIVLIIVSLILLITFTLLTLFIIDTNRMRNNEPVLFSTWGFDYMPPINLEEEKISLAIEEYIVSTADRESPHYNNEKYFTSLKKFLIVEKDDFKVFEVYAWVLAESFYRKDNEIIKESGFSMPYKFTVIKSESDFVVNNAEYPHDSNYEEELKRIFPYSVRKKIDDIHKDGTIERLSLDIEKQTKLYFHK